MTEAVVVDGVRTPVGKFGGALKDVRPDDLAALVVGEIVKRTKLDPAKIEDVVFGCANQTGEDNRNVAQMAVLLAGLSIEIAGQTINRLCGSGPNAINAAASNYWTASNPRYVHDDIQDIGPMSMVEYHLDCSETNEAPRMWVGYSSLEGLPHRLESIGSNGISKIVTFTALVLLLQLQHRFRDPLEN